LLAEALALGEALGAKPAMAQTYGMLAEAATSRNHHEEAAEFRVKAEALFAPLSAQETQEREPYRIPSSSGGGSP
jgi:hypothetical protein